MANRLPWANDRGPGLGGDHASDPLRRPAGEHDDVVPVNEHYHPAGERQGDLSAYTIDTSNSIPFFHGNVMLVKNITDENGRNRTVLERPPRPYMTLIAQPEEVANKTILERMWRNVHLNYNLDRAYVGMTAFPTLVYPIKETYTLMPFVPDKVSISAGLNMTRPGMHMKRIF